MKKIIFRSAFLVALVALAVLLVSGIRDKTADPLFDDIASGDSIDAKRSEESFNVLLVGVDSSEKLADAIMIVNVDKEQQKIKLISVPRDTKVYSDGKYQKINACYSDGVDELIDHVKRLTGVYINYYAVICPGTLATVVDALGGVEVDVEQDMKYTDSTQGLYIDLKKGRQTLSGIEAEQYCRYRQYVMGDLDRTKVQRNFFAALFEQKLNIKYVTKLSDLFKSLEGKIFTNVSFDDIMSNIDVLQMLSSDEQIVIYETPGQYNDMEKEGVSYYIIEGDNLRQLRAICNENFKIN